MISSPRFPPLSSSSASASNQPIYPPPSPLPPMPSTPEERIDQLLDHISPTEETDAARAEVFAFLRSVVDKCFAECKVRESSTIGFGFSSSLFLRSLLAPSASSFGLLTLFRDGRGRVLEPGVAGRTPKRTKGAKKGPQSCR